MSRFATVEEVRALLMSWLPKQAKKDARQGHKHPVTLAQSLSTGDLDLTASYQDIPGDGPSSDVAVTVTHPGDYLVFAFVDYNGVGVGDVGENLNVQLLVGSTAQTGIGEARLVGAGTVGLRGICAQVWKITVQAGNTIVKIQAKKTGGSGTSIVDGVGADTKLIVTSAFGGGGTGGAAAAATAHGSLTGLTSGDDHTQYVALADADYVDLTDGGATTLHSHAGGGDVVGPASATDTAVALFDSTTGKLVKDSVVLVGPVGDITGAASYQAKPASKPGIKILGQVAGSGDFTVFLAPAATMAANRNITLPDAAGVVALVDTDHHTTGTVDGVDVGTHDVATTGVHGAGASTLVHTGNASWVDLTDGGATTLHSHAGGGMSVAQVWALGGS